MVRICAVCNKSDAEAKTRPISFFRFPSRDLSVQCEWTDFVLQCNPEWVKRMSNSYVCSLHFRDNDIVHHPSRTHLLSDAKVVPSIFHKPQPVNQDESEEVDSETESSEDMCQDESEESLEECDTNEDATLDADDSVGDETKDEESDETNGDGAENSEDESNAPAVPSDNESKSVWQVLEVIKTQVETDEVQDFGDTFNQWLSSQTFEDEESSDDENITLSLSENEATRVQKVLDQLETKKKADLAYQFDSEDDESVSGFSDDKKNNSKSLSADVAHLFNSEDDQSLSGFSDPGEDMDSKSLVGVNETPDDPNLSFALSEEDATLAEVFLQSSDSQQPVFNLLFGSPNQQSPALEVWPSLPVGSEDIHMGSPPQDLDLENFPGFSPPSDDLHNLLFASVPEELPSLPSGSSTGEEK